MPVARSDELIAIVGMGCVVPDAFSVAAFRDNLLVGHTAIRDLARDSPRWRRYLGGDGAGDTCPSVLGAPVSGYEFDWRRFRIPPLDASVMNPMQLLALDAGDQALSALRVVPRETTGIFIGATGLGWQADSGLQIRFPDLADAFSRAGVASRLAPAVHDAVLTDARERLRGALKPVSDDTVVNASASVAAGRIAMHHDLRGPHYSIDAGFASSLAALETGVLALREGSVDLCLVGGVSELLTPLDVVAFARLGGLARARVAPFDTSADGTILGEGAVLFALKRLEDALRDGERIHAVVRGVAGATDPPDRALVAPSERGQEAVIRLAHERAGVDPRTIGFVECHATGTRLGDVTEVRALANVFARHEGARVALGSAKPFVGHLRGASGAVGMLRAVLALEGACIPAQINFDTPQPDLHLDETVFHVPTQPQALLPRGGASVARAAVSAFGFGGISYHAVLESHDPSRRAAARARTAPRARRPEPLAIVGMGSLLPRCDGVEQLRERLLAGFDATQEVPAKRWDIDRYFDANPTRLDTAYSRLGCFLDDYPSPRTEWRMPPATLASLDPEQLILLHAAEEAVRDAGYVEGRWTPERVMVSVGFLPYQGKRFLADSRVNFVEYALHLRAALRAAGVSDAAAGAVLAATEREFKATLPPITEDSLTGWLGSIGAARVARRWHFRGPHFVVDSACASSHAAIFAAANALRHDCADVALVGGTWCDMMPEFFVAACRFNALSATGITPFDRDADGFIPGEGAGVVVLRRLSDAERDGDRIHALLLSVEGSSDGRGRSVLAPKPDGEASALRRALAAANVAAGSVDYVECHGTGTALGDRVEAEAIAAVYGRPGGVPLLIGSVKSNFGHLNAAAGMPALIKAVIAVRDYVIAASLKCDSPNPDIDFAGQGLHVASRNTPWERADDTPRRAGVSGFGVGGTNFHMLVEEYRPGWNADDGVVSGTREERPPSIAAASGADASACVAKLAELAARAARAADSYEALLTHSRQAALASPTGEGVRAAIVAASPDELARRTALLEAALRRGPEVGYLHAQGVFIGTPRGAPVTLMFPGQGSQYPGMLRGALARFPRIGRTLERIDAAYERLVGRPLSPTFLAGDDRVVPHEDLHCAVFAVNCAVLAVLGDFGIRYDAVIGQSAGELSALVAAEVLTLEDALRAVRDRTLSVQRLTLSDNGRMIALACSASRAAQLIADANGGGTAAVAADNSPAASIVSASTSIADALLALAEACGIEARVLDVSHAYHSPIIEAARAPYENALSGLTFRAPRCEIVSTITGSSINALPTARYPKLLAQQFVQPVRLRQAIEARYAQGGRVFVECGPKWPLSTYIDDTLQGREHLAQPTLHPKVGEAEQLQRALAQLFVLGATTLEASLTVT